MIAPYSLYSDHCAELRLKLEKPPVSQVEYNNWTAADSAFKEFTEEEIKILKLVYAKNGVSMKTQIDYVANKLGIEPPSVWKLVTSLQYSIAYKRGLVE